MTRSLAVLRLAHGGGTVVLVDVPAVAAGLGVPVPPALESLLATLPADERAICARWAPKRQATFAAGRHALRLALVEAGVVADVDAVGAIGRDDRGAPVLPDHLAHLRRAVSITHKDSVAGALVVVDSASVDTSVDTIAVGCDLELDPVSGRDRHSMAGLARQVLSPHELQALVDDAQQPLDDVSHRRAVLERFSLKEALYKGLDPFVRRYVGFLEVGVHIDVDGAALFTVPDAGFTATGRVLVVPTMPTVVLTTARVQRG